MKLLVITNSRADFNAMETIAHGFGERGHDVAVWDTRHESFDNISGSYISVVDWDIRESDLAFVGGDRRETLLCALICADRGIPIAHLAGGDVTEGSADDRFRDAISMLARFHFATNMLAHDRIVGRLKRNGDFVCLSGSPAIDRIERWKVGQGASLVRSPGGPVVLAVHPNTSAQGGPLLECDAIIQAIEERLPVGLRYSVFAANADPGGADVNRALAKLSMRNRRVIMLSNQTPEAYYAMLASASLMIGNSSAGYYEAPSFDLPVVDVGDRQKGRMKPANVLNVKANPTEIAAAAQWFFEHRAPRLPINNPYGDGRATERIIMFLETHGFGI